MQDDALDGADGAAGFVVFTPQPVFARSGYIRAIGGAPAIRRSGIGRKLLAFTEQMTAKYASDLYLCVSSFNKVGQAFYRKCEYRGDGNVRRIDQERKCRIYLLETAELPTS